MTNETSQQQIAEAENKLISAIKTSDVAMLDSLLHDDLLFITPDGQTVSKQMDLDSHRAGTMVVEEIHPESGPVINVIGDTAISVSSIDTKGKMLGQPIRGRFKYIRVWKLFEGDWKVIGGSCTAL